MKAELEELLLKTILTLPSVKSFTVNLNAVANGIVDLGPLTDLLPTGWSPVTIMPVVPHGVNTNIFGNTVDYLIYDGHLYVKTYTASSNVSLEFHCLCLKA